MASISRTQVCAALAGLALGGSALAGVVEATYTIPFNTQKLDLAFGATNVNDVGAVVINGRRTGGAQDTFNPSIPTVFSTFCVEVGQNVQVEVEPRGSVGPTVYRHEVLPLLGSSTVTGGVGGPVTFDAARTLSLQRLFGLYFANPQIQTSAVFSAAFQAAVWEITFDAGNNLLAGGFVISGPAPVLTQAQSMLSAVALDTSAGVPLYLLRSSTAQDLITPIPTPGAAALLALGGLVIARRRRA